MKKHRVTKREVPGVPRRASAASGIKSSRRKTTGAQVELPCFWEKEESKKKAISEERSRAPSR